VRERTAAKRSAQCPAVPAEAGAAVLAGAGAGVLAGAAGVVAVVEEVGAAAGGVAAVDD